jgi:hypothetical protein
MTRDRRGFEYALEPMRSVTEWDVNDTARALATQNAAADSQQDKVDNLSNSFAEARADVIAQRQLQTWLDIGAQRLAHAYMAQVQNKLVMENAQLRELEHERDETMTRLTTLRKFAESLDRNKEAAVEEYDRNVVKQSYQQADDSWLQRLHWRKTS